MSEMSIGQFKARCLKVMDRVARTGEPVVVTRHGKPVVRVVPVEEEAVPVFGRLAGSVIRASGLISPIDEPWEAEATRCPGSCTAIRRTGSSRPRRG